MSSRHTDASSIEARLADVSLDDRAALTSGRDMWSTQPCEVAGAASVRMGDGPMGIASARIDERDIALLTPCPLALGASWNPELTWAVGELVAQEARARGINVVLAPNVNLARSPLAGRLFELFSEDPFLAGTMASGWIGGLQHQGVGATAKHFVANDSETDRHSMNSVVDEATLREVYLQPFEHCVRAGVWAVMTAYNRVNGTWCSSAEPLISDVLKREWGFDGVVLSDWFGTHDTVGDAGAGLDLEMPGPARHLGPAVAEAVRDGRISERRLRDAAQRVLRLAERTAAGPQTSPMTLADSRALLERATIEGCVLLRNEGLLPLTPGSGSLAVIGPNAATPCLQGGSFARIAIDPTRPDPLEAITARFAGTEIHHARGLAPDTRLPPLHACDIHAPDGEAGVLLEIRDEAGNSVFSEVRNTSLLIWFAEMPGFGRLDKSGALHIRTRFVARKSGVHRFLFGGTGTTLFTIDGVEVGLHDPQIAPADIIGTLTRGDSARVERTLEADEALALEYTMHFAPARAQGVWFGCAEPQADDELALALATARAADSVVLIVGESQDAALESVDRSTTQLAAAQVALIDAVCAVNPRTLVVVNAARPVAMDWADKAAAILQVWFPGQEFGPALARILAGDAEPGGRLPVSFAVVEAEYPAFDLTPGAEGELVYHERSAIGYRGLLAAGTPARYPFGHGLGFADIDLSLADVLDAGEQPVFRAVLRNHSDREGRAVVQLYIEPEAVDGTLGVSRLAGFRAVNVAAYSEAEVTLFADPLARRLWDQDAGDWHEPGTRSRYTIGLSAQDRRFTFAPGSVVSGG